jgi:hypothetical protein
VPTLDELRAGFLEPPATAAPMMRWWWFGPAVDRVELDRELMVMAAAGLGGVEVAYVYPFAPAEGTFLSPEFLGNLRYAADRAASLGLRYDLTLGSGWSFGGPHVDAAHAARRLHWDRREIGPEAAGLPVGSAWPGDELVAAYVGSGSLQEPPEELGRLPVTDETIMVPAGAGVRQVLLAWSRLTGQQVKRAAAGAEGPVLDHYSAAAARRHLREVGDPLLDAVPGPLLGSVFCDSLEVFGSDWTPALVEEFGARRGYELLPELYRLVVDGPDATRLRADVHRTLAELYESHFVAEFRAWAAARGVPFRIQSYGTPPALISSYRHADLVEGEGWGWTELTQTRWASSAAHLHGRDVVSSEVWTWVHSPSFRATPLDLKGEAHEHLLAGVNQLVGHGWPYSPADAPGVGWIFYAAGALDDRNPWWPAMPGLASYLTRLCWLLRQGSAVTDVLVHVSDEDVLSRMGAGAGGTLDAWREARALVGDAVLPAIRQNGWDYDLVDDTGLAALAPTEGRPVILSGTTALHPRARSWLERYAAAGGVVITVGATAAPAGSTAVPVTELPARLTATAGPGVRLVPAQTDIGVVRRRTPDTDVHLVVNTGPAPRSFRLVPAADRPGYEEWDAGTGQVVRAGEVGEGIELRLDPYQATTIVLSAAVTTDRRVDQGPGRRVELTEGWTVRAAGGDERLVELPHAWESDPAWTGHPGSAGYVTTVDLPELGPTAAVALDLGVCRPAPAAPDEAVGIRGHSYRVAVEPPVGVVAEVRVNGIDCGVAWAPPYVVDLTGAVRPGPNRVEITVHGSAATALAHDEHLLPVTAAAERRYGRRARIQDLDLALAGLRSGLLSVPTLVITG